MNKKTRLIIIACVFLGTVALGTALYLINLRKAQDRSQDTSPGVASKNGVYTQSQDISEIKTHKEGSASEVKKDAKNDKPSPPAQMQRRTPPPMPLEVNLYTSQTGAKGPVVSDSFAPYGRLIKCRLVMTIDSSRLQTPVIAEVMDEVWHINPDGTQNMIVERGVEVHGTSQGSPMRDRISTGTDWVLVWRNADSPNIGKELVVKGIALENSQEPDGDGFTITDGSAGIPGYAIQGSELKEIIALISTFVSGLGAGMVQSQTYTTDQGTTTSYDGNLKTAMALGVQRTAELYAQRMLRKIADDVSYVRAPAGTPFYLYVTQPLDLKKASIAGTAIDELEKEAKKDRLYQGQSQNQVQQPQQRNQSQQNQPTRQERQ